MKKYIILGVVVVIILAGYLAYRPQVHYYLYKQTVKSQPNFKEQEKALEEDYLKAFKNPKDATAVLDLGAKQFGLKDFKSAAENFKKVLEIQPDNITAQENLIRTYEYMKDYKSAEAQAKKYLEKFPQYPDAYSLMAELYGTYYTEKQSELENLFKTGYEKTGDDQFLLLLAGYYEKNKDYDKAIPLVEQWINSPKPKSENSKNITLGYLKELRALQEKKASEVK